MVSQQKASLDVTRLVAVRTHLALRENPYSAMKTRLLITIRAPLPPPANQPQLSENFESFDSYYAAGRLVLSICIKEVS